MFHSGSPNSFNLLQTSLYFSITSSLFSTPCLAALKISFFSSRKDFIVSVDSSISSKSLQYPSHFGLPHLQDGLSAISLRHSLIRSINCNLFMKNSSNIIYKYYSKKELFILFSHKISSISSL